MGLEPLTMTTDEHRRVIIDAQEVDRRRDDGEVAVLDCALKAADKSAIQMIEAGVTTSQGEARGRERFQGCQPH